MTWHPDTTANVHVRVPRARFDKALTAGLRQLGFAPTSDAAAATARLVVHHGKSWCALHDAAWSHHGASVLGWSAQAWAAFLSGELGAPALHLFTWEGEGTLLAERFDPPSAERGAPRVARRAVTAAPAASLELPRDAAAKKGGRLTAPAEAIAPWLAPGVTSLELEATRVGGVVIDRSYVGRDDSVPALALLLDLHEPWLDAATHGLEDDTSGARVLALRPLTPAERASDRVARPKAKVSTALPELPGPATVRGKAARDAAAAYRGRSACVAWVVLAGDEAARLAPLDEAVPKLLSGLLPPAGARVRVTRGGRREVLAASFSPSTRLARAGLAKGGRVELFAGGPDAADDPATLRFWMDHEREAAAPFVVVGWSFPLDGGELAPVPSAPPVRGQLLAARRGDAGRLDLAEDAFWWLMTLPSCVGGGLAVQGRGMLPDDPLPYETLAGTEGRWRDPAWLATHTRSPAWRLRLSSAQYARTGSDLPDHVSRTEDRPTGAVLLQAEALGPEPPGASAPVERYLFPALATAPRLRRARAPRPRAGHAPPLRTLRAPRGRPRRGRRHDAPRFRRGGPGPARPTTSH